MDNSIISFKLDESVFSAFKHRLLHSDVIFVKDGFLTSVLQFVDVKIDLIGITWKFVFMKDRY